jgi:hypothetical protein
MPIRPSYGESHYDKALTDFAIVFDTKPGDYVAGQAATTVPVDQESGAYSKFTLASWIRSQAGPRMPGQPLKEGGFAAEWGTYLCQENGLKGKIADRDRAGSVYDQDAAKTAFLLNQCMLEREIAFAADCFVTGKWTGEYDPAGAGKKWNDSTVAAIMANIDTGRRTIKLGCLNDPNVFIVGYDVHTAIKNDSAIKEQIKTVAGTSFDIAKTGEADLRQALAKLFELEEYIVAKAVYNSSPEGAASPTIGFVCAADNALLLYRPKTGSTSDVTALASFRMRGWGDNDRGIKIEKYPWTIDAADHIDASYLEDLVIPCNGAGYFFDNAIA